MKIGILQTDSVLDKFQAQFGNYPEMFIELFQRVDSGLEFAVYDVTKNQYPRVFEDCDAYVTTGSKASVYEDLTWIKTLQRYLVDLAEADQKLIAVCFGHQLVAQAFGGKTEKSDKGWGVGVHTIPIVIHKPWMQPDLDSYNVVVSHQDQVIDLPTGAELIASSEFCPNSLFQMGNNILSIQGHPEFSKGYAQATLQNRKQKIAPSQYEEAMQSWYKTVDDLTLARWWLEFLKE